MLICMVDAVLNPTLMNHVYQVVLSSLVTKFVVRFFGH